MYNNNTKFRYFSVLLWNKKMIEKVNIYKKVSEIKVFKDFQADKEIKFILRFLLRI